MKVRHPYDFNFKQFLDFDHSRRNDSVLRNYEERIPSRSNIIANRRNVISDLTAKSLRLVFDRVAYGGPKCCLASLVNEVMTNESFAIVSDKKDLQRIQEVVENIHHANAHSEWLSWDEFLDRLSQHNLIFPLSIKKFDIEIDSDSKEIFRKKLALYSPDYVDTSKTLTLLPPIHVTYNRNEIRLLEESVKYFASTVIPSYKPDINVFDRIQLRMDSSSASITTTKKKKDNNKTTFFGNISDEDSDDKDQHVNSLSSDDVEDDEDIEEDKSQVHNVFIQYRLNPLNDDDNYMVTQALQPPYTDNVLVEKFNIPITKSKLKCLLPSMWLNDEIINYYMQLLMDRNNLQHQNKSIQKTSFYFNSFFIDKLLENEKYNYNLVKR